MIYTLYFWITGRSDHNRDRERNHHTSLLYILSVSYISIIIFVSTKLSETTMSRRFLMAYRKYIKSGNREQIIKLPTAFDLRKSTA